MSSISKLSHFRVVGQKLSKQTVRALAVTHKFPSSGKHNGSLPAHIWCVSWLKAHCNLLCMYHASCIQFLFQPTMQIHVYTCIYYF